MQLNGLPTQLTTKENSIQICFNFEKTLFAILTLNSVALWSSNHRFISSVLFKSNLKHVAFHCDFLFVSCLEFIHVYSTNLNTMIFSFSIQIESQISCISCTGDYILASTLTTPSLLVIDYQGILITNKSYLLSNLDERIQDPILKQFTLGNLSLLLDSCCNVYCIINHSTCVLIHKLENATCFKINKDATFLAIGAIDGTVFVYRVNKEYTLHARVLLVKGSEEFLVGKCVDIDFTEDGMYFAVGWEKGGFQVADVHGRFFLKR